MLSHALLRRVPLVALPLLTALLVGPLAPAAAADPWQGLPAAPAVSPAASSDPASDLLDDPSSRPLPTGTGLTLPTLGARVVAEAATHKGKPYRWGATGPSRFDCSGYVRYVFARVGTPLPRTAGQQYAATRRVAQADKQPGDLVFTRSSSGRIDHVGIYAGAGTFWVAPKAGDVVKRQRLYTSRYSVGRV